MSETAWEAVFMLVILKIPIVYLVLVVLWAIRSEPRPLEGAALPAVPPVQPWRSGGRRNSAPRPWRGGPHGAPVRSYSRRRAPAHARAPR